MQCCKADILKTEINFLILHYHAIWQANPYAGVEFNGIFS
jgi:hypothetical protein